MFISPLQNALLFCITSLSSAYISIVLFRFLLQLVNADFYNPLAQFSVKVTNPLVQPLRKLIPTVARADLATLTVALLIQALGLVIIWAIKGFSISASLTSLSGLLIWSLGEIVDLTLVILLFATFIQIIASWLQPGAYNPAIDIMRQLTAPLFTPIRRLVPNIGVLDFSPMLVIFLIVFMRLLFADFLISLGKSII